MTEQAASRAAIAVLLVLVLLLVSPPVGAQLLRQEFRGSPVVVAAAPSCTSSRSMADQDSPALTHRLLRCLPHRISHYTGCKGCSYGEAGCCCAPNDARPLRVTVTVPPKPISRTLFVTRFRTATVTLGKAATRGKANLKSSNEEDLELGSQPKQPEPAQRQLPQEGPKFLGVQPEDVPNGEDEDEGDKPSTDEQDNESTHELFARHICPRCPKGARILSLSSGRAANGLPICCPPRKTVTRTMTRGTIRIVWKTSTRYLTRTSTRTASSVRKTSSKTKTLTRTTLDPLRWITKLEGTLFNDINGNGIQDPNEPGTGNALLSLWSLVVARARVQGRSPNTLLNRTTTTSGTGYFLFTFEPILVGTPLRISKKEGAVEHPLAEVTATPATQALNLTVADLAINGSSSTTTVQAGGAKSTTSRTVAGGGQSMSLSSTSTTRESTTLKTSETETPRTSETTTSQTSETVSPQSSSTSLTDAPTPTTTRVPTTTSSISKSPSSSTTLAVGVSIAGLSTSATAAGTTTLSQTSSSFTESYSTSESLTSSTETLSSTSFTESSTSASLTTSSRTQSLTSSTSSKSQSSSSLSRTRTSSTLSETLTSTTGPTSSTTESETTTSETETTSESETTSSETPVTTSSTRTTNTRTTSLTKTSSTSETETTTTSRTLYTVDPSYVPVVNPGSVGAIAWRTDWGDIELGNPVGTIQLVCVNVDEPCTATPVATSGDPVPLDQVNTLIVIGLAQNTNYTCYGIVTYETGPVCTSGTLVTVGPGILLSIWHPDGRRWTFNDDERYIGLEQTANFSLRTYAQRDVSINWNENYIQFFESDRSAWLRGRYQDVLDLNPGSADEAFQIWKNPTGGYALWSSRQYFVGYNNDSDWVMDGPGENWVFPIFNWTIVPDPSEGLAELPGAYYAGVLTAPKIPPATYGTFEYSMFIASIVNPGGSSGAPTGRYKVRCVYLDESCTAYPRWETPFYAANSVESVSGITGAWVGGLDPGQTYSCYSVADNYYAEVCSSSADISIPAVENATLYSFAHPSGLVWRWYQGPTDQHPWLRLSQGTAGVQFVMYKPYPDENWCRMWSPNTGSSMHAFFAYWDGPKFSIRDTPTGYNGRLRFWRKSPNHFAIQIQDWSAYLSYYNNTGEDDFITLTNYGGSTFVSDWIITPEPELCIAGNFTVAAPPSMPDVGSWYANMWTTTVSIL